MTKKIDSNSNGIITGPALTSVSRIVCERSGTKGGVAVTSCAKKGDALRRAANSNTQIFMRKFRNDRQGDYRMQMSSPGIKHTSALQVARQSLAAHHKNMC